jgi:hypothetical protein
MGCFTEGTNTRALGAASYPSNTNTIAQCAASCSAYKYFGAEYGREVSTLPQGTDSLLIFV